MPQPAPAEYTLSDRRALRASLAIAFGPLATLGVLVAGYALSARVCTSPMRAVIGVCVALAIAGCGACVWTLWRARREPPAAVQRLHDAAIGLLLFCVFVLCGFAIALASWEHCA